VDKRIHIRFAGLDEANGLIFLQFSFTEDLATIDQSTIHGFSPNNYKVDSFDQLIPHMISLGHNFLKQQALVADNKFNKEQLHEYGKLIGTNITCDLDNNLSPDDPNETNLYNSDMRNNPNSQIDEVRCIVLEILAEEGLIPGGIK